MSLEGQKPKLPRCNINGRFTSVSGHKGRRIWMMRALRILDSPYAPTLGARSEAKPGAVEQARTAVAETCGADLNRPV
jgi:hypothetical protein